MTKRASTGSDDQTVLKKAVQYCFLFAVMRSKYYDKIIMALYGICPDGDRALNAGAVRKGVLFVNIEFRKAELSDAQLLIDIYNASFYSDYLRYGECPAYGKTLDVMRKSIMDYTKFLIVYDDKPVGCVSCKELESGVYEVGCLCVIPEYQGRGIGTAAMEFAKTRFSGWRRFTLVTPIDKTENVRFYTEKCGFDIQSVEKDGSVELYRFVLER